MHPPSTGQVPPGRAAALPYLLLLALCAPALVFSYLPMTDLPQHVATTSMLAHLRDPAYGFADFFQIDLSRTLYLLPYGLGVALSQALSPQRALNGVVFLSLISLPLGIQLCLRALGRSPWPGLLALPLCYGRPFFWGFINFTLSIGLSFIALSLCLRAPPPTRAGRLGQGALLGLCCAALVLTHVYGLVILGVTLGLWFALDPPRRRDLLRRLPALSPALLGAGLWGALGARAQPWGDTLFPTLRERVALLGDSVLGGYQDPTETTLLVLVLLAAGLLATPSAPVTRARWAALPPLWQALYLLAAGQIILYFTLPTFTPTAKFVYFRHAWLAATLLPLLAAAPGAPATADTADAADAGPAPRLGRRLALLIGVCAIGNAWGHLWLFDREARSFDGVVAALPPRPRLLSLTFDRDGAVMQTFPYLHFGAYAQARKGGLLAMTFSRVFWNIPVRLRDDVAIPPTPPNLEWEPRAYDHAAFGHFYDHVLVRLERAAQQPDRALSPCAEFPYELIHYDPPWQLYRATARPLPSLGRPRWQPLTGPVPAAR